MEFIDQGDLIACMGFDWLKGDDDIFLGSIKLNKDDKYYWFHPSARRIPLTCRQLIEISGKLSELNINGA